MEDEGGKSEVQEMEFVPGEALEDKARSSDSKQSKLFTGCVQWTSISELVSKECLHPTRYMLCFQRMFFFQSRYMASSLTWHNTSIWSL